MEKELMEFVILPLTYAGKEKKQEIIQELFEEAKKIEDEKTQIFLVAGIMVFADKVIDEALAERMKGWIMMTKVARLFEEEKMEAVKKKEEEITRENALSFLKEGVSVEKVAKCIPALTLQEVEELAKQI